MKCGFTGDLWYPDSLFHLNWCRSNNVDAVTANAKTAKRAEGLKQCLAQNAPILSIEDKTKVSENISRKPDQGKVEDGTKISDILNGTASNCATIPIEPDAPVPAPPPATPPVPPQTGPITIEKTKAVDSCTVDGGCQFYITLINTTNSIIDGPFEFDDVVTADDAIIGNTQIEPAKSGLGTNWTCQKTGQSFLCRLGERILPKSSQRVIVSFKLGGGIGAPKQIKNCATLKGATNKACASIPLNPVIQGPRLRSAKRPRPRRAVPTARLRFMSKTSATPRLRETSQSPNSSTWEKP